MDHTPQPPTTCGSFGPSAHNQECIHTGHIPDHTHTHDHAEDHTHDHSHSHDHNHARGASHTRLAAALALTSTILIAELIGAILSGSLSLAADAGHMLVDSSGLAIALLAAHLMRRPRTPRYTWGLARAEILAAAFQAGILLVVSLLVAYEAIRRILTPEPLHPTPMLIVGIIGLAANAGSLLILAGGRDHNLNLKAAFLEVANDALGSLAVILAAILALTLGWTGVDTAASLLIVALMIPRAWRLLRTAILILLEATPDGINTEDIRNHMLALPHVTNVHDLHVTTVATGVIALTAHIGTEPGLTDTDRLHLLHDLEDCAASHFGTPILHTTFQLDTVGHEAHEALKHSS